MALSEQADADFKCGRSAGDSGIFLSPAGRTAPTGADYLDELSLGGIDFGQKRAKVVLERVTTDRRKWISLIGYSDFMQC